MKTLYFIEILGADGCWFIAGQDDSCLAAIRWARHYEGKTRVTDAYCVGQGKVVWTKEEARFE